MTFFDCGQIENHKNMAIDYTVGSINNINYKIIPFFNNYSLKGFKYNDFKKFKEVLNIINNKKHLTEKGLEKIRSIKNTKI